MPVCDGLSTGPCPDQRNDNTVSLGEGELLLCRKCNAIREQEFIDKMIAEGKLPPDYTRPSSVGGKTRSQKKSDIELVSVTGPVNAIVNELLTFVAHYRNRSNNDMLRQSILSFYTAPEIGDSKKVIVNTFQSRLEGCSLIVDRRPSTARPAHVAEIDDIIGLFDFLDEKNCLGEKRFAAANLERLPKFGPEEMNVCAIVNRQAKMDNVMEKLVSDVDQLRQQTSSFSCPDFSNIVSYQSEFVKSISDMHQSIVNFQSSVNTRIDHLNTICTQLNSSVPSSVSTSVTQNTPGEIDRSLNIVVYGIAENVNISVWKQRIDDTLNFIVGRVVATTDAFRLGKYADGKTRPVLVKLKSAWDKRLILRGSYKLKDRSDKVFVFSDEPLETRRKQMMDRIKSKAEREGKIVSVVDDVLHVNNVATFSLKDGYLRKRNGDK